MGKKVLSITVEEKILSDWKKYTEENCINASKLIEKMLKEHLEKRGKKWKVKKEAQEKNKENLI